MPVQTETPLEPPAEAAAETARAAPPPATRPPVAWRPTDEPRLGTWLRGRWRWLPGWVRATVAMGLLAIIAGVAVVFWYESTEPPSEESIQTEAAVARTAWAAARRQAPAPLELQPDGSFFAEGTLEPGDAETTVGRYVDFLTVTLTDSVEASVIATSAAFRPDVGVQTPDGARLGASVLLGTEERAEVVGLRGPGRFDITITSTEPGQTGAYEITTARRLIADTLAIGDPLRADTLGTGRPRAGRYVRAYSLLAEPDRPVILEVVSPAFRPRLTLLGPAGEIRQQRTLERGVAGDSLFGTLLRFHPGWDLPYTLLVSSDAPDRTGPFAMEMRTVDAESIVPNGRAISGTLGPDSWLRDGRYLDAYRFRVREDDETEISVESREFAPALQLWREERHITKEVLTESNRAERSQISVIRDDLEPGTYVLEISTAEGAEAGIYPGGPYTLRVRSGRPEPPAPITFDPDDPDAPRGWFSGASAQGQGTTPDGETFVVSAAGISVSYPGGDQTLVQIGVSVRSVDYEGPWAPWRRFAAQSTLVDAAGRRYRPLPAQSAGTGVLAEPGSTRRGRLVFVTEGAVLDPERLILTAPLGGDATVPLRLRIER
ncbi:MAG: hypothetical protein AAF791_01660 [Bacteroidota bacterium]